MTRVLLTIYLKNNCNLFSSHNNDLHSKFGRQEKPKKKPTLKIPNMNN